MRIDYLSGMETKKNIIYKIRANKKKIFAFDHRFFCDRTKSKQKKEKS
jgi:hypothetical protein